MLAKMFSHVNNIDDILKGKRVDKGNKRVMEGKRKAQRDRELELLS